MQSTEIAKFPMEKSPLNLLKFQHQRNSDLLINIFDYIRKELIDYLSIEY